MTQRLSSLFLSILLFLSITSTPLRAAETEKQNNKPNPEWLSQRFSMFIHWGLYSQLGGVWDGKPVEWGYSEQIQSFAGIFGDYYAATADTFTAPQWNADSIAALAKAAGMKSIVMTSKHHDGFSMYDTRYSKYNVVQGTPFGRNPLLEMSRACEKAGLRFGVYFSLIDWNFPQAYPISSHNADPITPQHHQHNLNQVRELMTGYGPISEIWFDMGALTRQQSKELYELVTTLQPQCMVSGRLGNDFGDFAVMADNACPDYNIGIPWQSAGSVFKETWSYRSWQKRENLPEKIQEKINTLKEIVRHGGNYLLNIGPRGDGSVVEYERDLLLGIGKWLKDSSNVLYSTANTSSPSAKTLPITTARELNSANAAPIFGYSAFDYYSSFRSIIGYQWHLGGKKKNTVLKYHTGDADKTVELTFNGKTYPVKLENGTELRTCAPKTTLRHTLLLTKGKSSFAEQFIQPQAWEALSKGLYTKTDFKMAADAGWKVLEDQQNPYIATYTGEIGWRKNIWLAHILDAEQAGELIALFCGSTLQAGAADALEIWLNGKQLFKKGYTNILPTAECVNLPLQKGQNVLVVKLHNRFNDAIRYVFSTAVPQQWYQVELPFRPSATKEGDNILSLSLQGRKGGADIGLRDLKIIFE